MLIVPIAARQARVVPAGVEFSQVDFGPIYIAGAVVLALFHLVSVASVPRRLLSARAYRLWISVLLSLLALFWVDLAVAFSRPELMRGRDLLNLFLLIGCPVVAPLTTLAVSAWLRLSGALRRRGG